MREGFEAYLFALLSSFQYKCSTEASNSGFKPISFDSHECLWSENISAHGQYSLYTSILILLQAYYDWTWYLVNLM